MKYKTIKKNASVSRVIKKSKFLGSAAPVQDVLQAKEFVKEVSKNFKDANHNAFAYSVGIKEEFFAFSDNGEPSKSAGNPIYCTIKGLGVTNAVIVVTRYFGGIKLGIGGLIRAYSDTAKMAIEAAGIVEKKVFKKISLSFPYNESRLVMYMLDKFGAEVLERKFGEETEMHIGIDEDLAGRFMKEVASKSYKIRFKDL